MKPYRIMGPRDPWSILLRGISSCRGLPTVNPALQGLGASSSSLGHSWLQGTAGRNAELFLLHSGLRSAQHPAGTLSYRA